jgi:hypothetical protein
MVRSATSDALVKRQYLSAYDIFFFEHPDPDDHISLVVVIGYFESFGVRTRALKGWA